MRTLRASRAAIFRRVELPWALPSAFSGARVAASYAAVAALFAEYAGGSSGLGETMQTATAQLDGKVAVIGGSNGQADLASIEVFDPAAGSFVACAAGARARSCRRASG